MTTPATTHRGGGWVAFAGILLMLAGLRNLLDGIWALDREDTPVDTVIFDDNLAVWGWFYIVVGVILVAAGIAVFNRSAWARMVGIVAASLAVIFNSFWIFAYPIAAGVSILLAVLVIYALAVYGEGEGVEA